MVNASCAFCEREKPPVWWPSYPVTIRATRIAAFVILARMEATRSVNADS